MHLHHISFIHSSADGHLGCFHVLATVNSAAVNIELHVLFKLYIVFSQIYAQEWVWIAVLSLYLHRVERGGENLWHCLSYKGTNPVDESSDIKTKLLLRRPISLYHHTGS